ncbi:hypothetical protein F2Q68_00031128 [Brassica cretica]|uniref:Uncharacterized protein n=1 Tax=Brassica cretica TaxID=69181 RepID=A0A8S9G2F7_BRACR|nr:hypothetical protein F2Q68_00031128 [Brassica cretica]
MSFEVVRDLGGSLLNQFQIKVIPLSNEYLYLLPSCKVSIDASLVDLRIVRESEGSFFEGPRNFLFIVVPGIPIDTLVETSTDYSIRISIDAFGQALMHGLNVLTKLPRSALALLYQS